MRIELMEQNIVKVFLSAADLSQHDITYGNLNCRLPENRRLIAQIVNRVKETTGLDFTTGRLFVEAFPHPKDGCVLYISKLSGKAGRSGASGREEIGAPLIFRLDTLEDLAQVCKSLFWQYSHLFTQSALYRVEKHYILLLYSYFQIDRRLILITEECGRYIGRGELMALAVKEHGVPIAEKNAVETIVECLC